MRGEHIRCLLRAVGGSDDGRGVAAALEQRPEVVEHVDPRPVGRREGGGVGEQPGQQGAAAAAWVAVGEHPHPGAGGERHRVETGLRDAQEQGALGRPGVRGGRPLARFQVGEPAQRGRGDARPARVRDRRGEPHRALEITGVASAVAGALARTGGRGDLHGGAPFDEAAPGHSRRHRGGGGAAVLALHRVVEPQLDPRGDLLEPLGRQLRPAGARHRDVHAGTRALDEQPAECRVEVGEPLAERHELVEQQHRVRRTGQLAGRHQLAPARGTVHAVPLSAPSALVEQPLELADDAAHGVGVLGVHARRDVRKGGERTEGAAAEVHHVEPQQRRRMTSRGL